MRIYIATVIKVWGRFREFGDLQCNPMLIVKFEELTVAMSLLGSTELILLLEVNVAWWLAIINDIIARNSMTNLHKRLYIIPDGSIGLQIG